MNALPGTEPFHHQGSDTGVLLCHGFASSPQSMRPWAERLAERGMTVSLPLLPGHGTTWPEMAATSWPDWYAELDLAAAKLAVGCSAVFAAGQSLGGCLALLLAQRRSDIRGVILVNPSLAAETRLIYLTPLLRYIVPTTPGVTSDIKKSGVTETAYDRTPLRAVTGLPRLWAAVRRGLPLMDVPVLAFRSTEDHATGPRSLHTLQSGLRPGLLTVRQCANSYHVAVLDHDAEMIFQQSAEFIGQHAARA